MSFKIRWVALLLASQIFSVVNANSEQIRVLSFQGNNGFPHESMDEAVKFVETLGKKNNWFVAKSNDESFFALEELLTFDVVIFNNNCGNRGRVLSDRQQQNFQHYIRNGGGFVGVHCPVNFIHEGAKFNSWFKRLVGTGFKKHPPAQSAKVLIENKDDRIGPDFLSEWTVVDEWYNFTENPRDSVEVLLSVDEDSYEGGDRIMGGDHPIAWRQHFDGGRSFYTSLGHSEDIYTNPQFIKHLENGIIWAALGESAKTQRNPVTSGLLLDLDADFGVELSDKNKVSAWKNKVTGTNVDRFVRQDEGRKIAGSGRPRLRMNVQDLNGHNSLVFHQQELVNMDEDAFDHLTNGAGYTWFAVISAYEQQVLLKDVNAFFGNLRNTNLDRKGHFEGFWGGLTDTNIPWAGARNGMTGGRWNKINHYLADDTALESGKYYLLAGRLGSGKGEVSSEFFVADMEQAVATASFTPFKDANPSKMVIGQERDATNHPGKESFDGEIATFLIYERPLSDSELKSVALYLSSKYGL